MANSHGSAFLRRYCNLPIDDRYLNSKTNNRFLLGLNVGVNCVPLNPPEAVDNIISTPENKRLDTPEWGMLWSPAERRGMALTFGYTQSGKGGVIVPAALTYPGSMVFNDPKGELYWITALRRGKLGKVALCDPFDQVNKNYASKAGERVKVTRYNPLAHLNADSDDFAEQIATLGEALAIDVDGGNSIFSGTGRDLIEGVIAAEATMNPGRATLREVRRWLTLSDPDFAGAVTTYLEEHPTGLAAAKLRQFTDMTSKMNQSTKGTAKEQTKFLDSEQIVRYFEPESGEETFSFNELSTGTLTVYIVLPGKELGKYKSFSRLLFNQALDAVASSAAPNMDYPVTFICDEAGTSLGKLDAIEQAYGLSAGTGVLIWSFYQDISQLKRDYPKSYNTFVSNSAAVTVLGARDEETCEYFSKFMGNATIQVTGGGKTEGTSSGPDGERSTYSEGSSTTTSDTGRPLMYPDEIRQMPDNHMLVLVPGIGNYRQFKVRYFEDARFSGMYRPDPKYGDNAPSRNAIAPVPQPVGKPAEKPKLLYMIASVVLGLLALRALFGVLDGGPFASTVILFLAGGGAGYLYWKGRAVPRVPGWYIHRHASGRAAGWGFISM